MEKMILTRLSWYLENNQIYPEAMSGFRSGRSAIDNVIDLITCVEHGISERKTTIAIFLDIRKAFDSVEHAAILTALSEHGIGGRIYSWIEDYLNNRTVFMDTMEGRTSPHTVNRGVPQGGVLSPTLFNFNLRE